MIEWVGKQEADRPLFVYLALPVPHDPRTAPAEFRAMYDPARLTLSKNFMPRHPFDNGELEVRDEQLAPSPARRRRCASTSPTTMPASPTWTARRTGDRRLQGDRPVSENTVVVFTSDQGLAVGGRHGLMGKQNLYEHVKPPLVVAGPGVPHGRSEALVYLYDLFPTAVRPDGGARPGRARRSEPRSRDQG